MGKHRAPNRKLQSQFPELSQVRAFSRDMVHDIDFYVAPDGSIPARDFLNSCPPKVKIKIQAHAVQIATAPPKNFSGGGKWEAMHAPMTGWFEIRIQGVGDGMLYRIFCILDYEANEVGKPLMIMVDGRRKRKGTTIPESEYLKIKKLGTEYFSNSPRRLTSNFDG